MASFKTTSASSSLWFGLFLALLWSHSAHAHLVSTRFGEFYAGLLHPLTTLVHFIPWVAFGFFCSLQNREVVLRCVWLFPLSVGIGVFLENHLLVGMNIDYTHMNVASFLCIGILLILVVKLSTNTMSILVALFGVSHGLANGLLSNKETPSDASEWQYVLGVSATAYLIMVTCTAIAFKLRESFSWTTIVLRAAGSWTIAIGILFGAFLYIDSNLSSLK